MSDDPSQMPNIEDNPPEPIIPAQRPKLLRARRARRPRVPKPVKVPDVPFKCYKISSFVSSHSDVTETRESHPASLILPPELLMLLTKYDVKYPVYFQLENSNSPKTTCCGVSMFIADRGNCYTPDWIMENLSLETGDWVLLRHVITLPTGTYAKLEPQSVDFLDIDNPKEALERTLSKIPCISTGDVIPISYNGKVYKLKVLETIPESSISILNSDLSVDFVKPLGYVDPDECHNYDSDSRLVEKGYRLNGKTLGGENRPLITKTGMPDWDWELGQLCFDRRIKKSAEKENTDKPFQPFTGSGFTTGSGNDSQTEKKKVIQPKHSIASLACGGTPGKVARCHNSADVSEMQLDGEIDPDFDLSYQIAEYDSDEEEMSYFNTDSEDESEDDVILIHDDADEEANIDIAFQMSNNNNEDLIRLQDEEVNEDESEDSDDEDMDTD